MAQRCAVRAALSRERPIGNFAGDHRKIEGATKGPARRPESAVAPRRAGWYGGGVSRKSEQIAARIAAFQGRRHNAHYVGFFDCFNRQLFFAAHDVLEELWLADRHGPNGDFFKGLIQLAGAFVHLQKDRLRPAAALFRLAQANLEKYPGVHEQLQVPVVLALIATWHGRLEAGQFAVNPLRTAPPPSVNLEAEVAT